MWRPILERLSRRVVLKRRLPARYGGQAFYVSPGSALRYWKWNVEAIDPPLLNFAAEFVKPGDTVWDIGANVGLFTFAAAGLAGPSGHVLAIEPDSWLVGLLRRSARLRPDHRAKVQVIPAAAAESLGVRRFFVAERGRSANYIEGAGTAESGGVREEQLVVTLTLDWLLTAFPAPRIVKIDVEGMEPRVLQGAAHVLQSVRPTILCEVMESNQEEVTKLLRSAGYTLYNMEHDKGARHAQEHAAFNTLACPPA